MSDGFQVARLIPVSGITNNIEAEMRATSALLAVLTVVRDFSISVLSPLGASTARRATVEAFIETKFKLADGTVVRPDGLLQVTYGASSWKALVEVKTGDNIIEADQINHYLQVAREQNIAAVLTISNEIGIGDQHPCEGVKLKSSKVRLAHLSWTELLAMAVTTKVHRGVEDPEQAWILGELIRYLEHRSSGAMAFQDMGSNWTVIRDGAREGTLRKQSPEVREIAGRWDQLMRFAALRLGADIGADVHHVVPRAQAEPKTRLGFLTDSLVGAGTLDGVIRVPGAAGSLFVAADLRARRIAVTSEVVAPNDRGNRARITWLVKQLGPETPSGLTVEAWGRNARQPISTTLGQLREDRDVLLDPEKRELVRFRLVQRAEMGQLRKDGGRSQGFIQSVVGLLSTFYAEVLQQIVPWTAAAPQVKAVSDAAELVDQPIEDAGELDQAIDAARAVAADETGGPAVSSGEAGEVDEDLSLGEDDDFVMAAPPIETEIPLDQDEPSWSPELDESGARSSGAP